uniref:Uncharacterized protein n=1 Tax=Nelumbo nucifera TaxID=4432 RepID=A0A822ZH72_NELNU|nr:TPA_asm: hypothetical protein HUJ06_002070 [Nelumbo nucifera]
MDLLLPCLYFFLFSFQLGSSTVNVISVQ